MSVPAVFNYPRRDPSGAPPKINKCGDGDSSKETMVVDSVSMPVHNVRDAAMTLEKNGFKLVSHETNVDFDKIEEIDSKYISEIEELVKLHTGAERCILFDTTVRKVQKAGSAAGFAIASKGAHTTSAVSRVHGDYTVDGAPRRVIELSKPTQSGSYNVPRLSESEAAGIVAGRRFMIVNVWRNISRKAPVKRMPLAMVDCATVPPEDMFTVKLIFKDRVGENLALDIKDAHRWCYFPDMLSNEAILFKTFDNVNDASVSGRFTIHSAFEDPTTRPEDPTRESIEARVLVIFAEQGDDDGQAPFKRMLSESFEIDVDNAMPMVKCLRANL